MREDPAQGSALLRPASESDGQISPANESAGAPARSWARVAALVAVPIFWGSYTPSMKLLLTFANPPPALLTNLVSHTIGSLALCLLWFAASPTGQFETPEGKRRAVRASCELGIYLFFGQLTQLLGAAALHRSSSG
jgi:hypothetical protein